MRVLFFCDHQDTFGNATRISKAYKYIRGLAKDVEVVNLFKRHDSWAKLSVSPAVLKSGIRNIGTWDMAHIKSETLISIGLDVLRESLKKKPPDIIFAEETRMAYVALKCHGGIPVIADLHGIISAEYGESPDACLSSRHLSRMKEIEQEVCDKASHILAVSNHMKEYLRREYGAGENRVTVVQNGADLHSGCATYDPDMKLVYGGMFNYWEDVDTFVNMAKKDMSNRYVLIGTGPLRSHLLERIEKEGIKVEYLGSKKRTEALDLFCKTSIGVAPSTRNVTRYVASPVKIYDYMACGLPIITANCGEWAKHVEENDCGLVAKNSNADEFLHCAESMRNRAVWEEKSQNGRKAIRERFNWNRVLAPLGEVLRSY